MHQHYGVRPGQSDAVQEELFHVISTLDLSSFCGSALCELPVNERHPKFRECAASTTASSTRTEYAARALSTSAT